MLLVPLLRQLCHRRCQRHQHGHDGQRHHQFDEGKAAQGCAPWCHGSTLIECSTGRRISAPSAGSGFADSKCTLVLRGLIALKVKVTNPPAPLMPPASPAPPWRTSAMNSLPCAGSTRWLKLVCALPCLKKSPSWTFATCKTCGSNATSNGMARNACWLVSCNTALNCSPTLTCRGACQVSASVAGPAAFPSCPGTAATGAAAGGDAGGGAFPCGRGRAATGAAAGVDAAGCPRVCAGARWRLVASSALPGVSCGVDSLSVGAPM